MAEHYDPDVFGTFEPERPPAEAIWDYCTLAIEKNRQRLFHLANEPDFRNFEKMKLRGEIYAYENVIDYIRRGYSLQKAREEAGK